jgi:hypothetical protein
MHSAHRLEEHHQNGGEALALKTESVRKQGPKNKRQLPVQGGSRGEKFHKWRATGKY